jgi:hypothetical protein
MVLEGQQQSPTLVEKAEEGVGRSRESDRSFKEVEKDGLELKMDVIA